MVAAVDASGPAAQVQAGIREHLGVGRCPPDWVNSARAASFSPSTEPVDHWGLRSSPDRSPALFADVARQGGGHPSVPAEVIVTVMGGVLRFHEAGCDTADDLPGAYAWTVLDSGRATTKRRHHDRT